MSRLKVPNTMLLDPLPPGGSAGQYLAKTSATDYATGWQTLSLAPWSVATGHLTVTPDNTYDIGAAGTNRPRDLHLGRNLTLSGVGPRITADMSSSPATNRLLFQNSIANALSVVGVLPNGTATQAQFNAYNTSDPANSATLQAGVHSAAAFIIAGAGGTGVYQPLSFSTGGVERMSIATNGIVSVLGGFAANTIKTADIQANAVSQVGFAVGSTVGPTTTLNSYADIPEMSVTLTTTGGVVVAQMSINVTQTVGAVGAAQQIAFSLDGAPEVGVVVHMAQTLAYQTTIPVLWSFGVLAAGSHTIKGRWLIASTGNTLQSPSTRRYLMVMELKR